MKKIFLAFLLVLSGFAYTHAEESAETVVKNLFKAAKSKHIYSMSKTELSRYFDEELTELLLKTRENGEESPLILHTEGKVVTKFNVKEIESDTVVVSNIEATYEIASSQNPMNTTLIKEVFELGRYEFGWRISEISSTHKGFEGEAAENEVFLSERLSGFLKNQALPASQIINSKAISLGKPFYPAEAKANKISGLVHVRVTIDEVGNVVSAKQVWGDSIFKDSVEQAALQSKFSPTFINGKSVKIKGFIAYNFSF